MLLATVLVLGAAPAGFAAPVRADFNGDGYADLAIGAPGENSGSGVVHVIYGSAGGLQATGAGGAPNDQVWSQASLGIGGGPEAGDQFGAALATGDFNGDGFADLAIGVPGEDHSGATNAGVVHIIYGSTLGLNAFGVLGTPAAQLWSQASPGFGFETPEGGDRFGSALAAGDFNGDGHDDLAIGVPDEDHSGATNAGVVHIIYGSPAGLQTTSPLAVRAPQQWSQALPAVKGLAENLDFFGGSLAAGDFNGDGVADLAIGAFGDDGGFVHVLYGTTAVGLQATGLGGAPDDQLWSQNSLGIAGGQEPGDAFGNALAAGDFNGDGIDDLAIGVDHEDHSGAILAGVVHVIYGSTLGLNAFGFLGTPAAQLWSQASPGVVGTPDPFDRFGRSLTAGDFNGDGVDDLAIGVVGDVESNGVVHVIYGSGAGLDATGAFGQPPAQLVAALAPQTFDFFGVALAASDFDGDGAADLAISAGTATSNITGGEGRVEVLYGSGTGLTAPPQIWQQGSNGLAGTPEIDDRFGFSLAATGRTLQRASP